jgi:hypothetical protein
MVYVLLCRNPWKYRSSHYPKLHGTFKTFVSHALIYDAHDFHATIANSGRRGNTFGCMRALRFGIESLGTECKWIQVVKSCGFAYWCLPYVPKVTPNWKVNFVMELFFPTAKHISSQKENGRILKKIVPLDKFQDKVRTLWQANLHFGRRLHNSHRLGGKMRKVGRKGVINCWGAQALPLCFRNPQGSRTRSP